MLAIELEAEPGARAEYSDPGFILLGKALEVIAGERLDSWARREVFDPLGMRQRDFARHRPFERSIPPTEEDTSFRHRRIQGEVQDENAYVLGGVAGHAGLFSNIADLLCFAREILAHGQRGKHKRASFRPGDRGIDLPSGRDLLAVRWPLDGIRLRRIRLRPVFFRRIRSVTSVTAVVRCGSIWKRRSPWYC